ncbi:MAG: DUF4062 domain-containing protein [Desulfobaccales bacterium]
MTTFIASPSDLRPEREAARKAVDRINKVLARRLNWHLELIGWEDTLPGYSRPQSLINKDVDSCDLFLGVLWRRWGQSTKTHESGFEEEFLRACDRRVRTGKPEIWLFFKAVDTENANDPGEQLRKVLDFKKKQIESKELLFKEFSDTETWKDLIHDELSAYLVDLSNRETEITQEKLILIEESSESQIIEETSSIGPTGSYSPEIISLFENISKQIKDDKELELDLSDRTRLLLLSSTWFSQKHSSGLFDTHQINLAYLRRSEWNLSYSEKWFLLRSFMSDIYDYRPGWFWFRERDESVITEIISWLALYDSNDTIRKMAIRLLANTRYNAERSFLEKVLSDLSKEDVIKEAINLVTNSQDPEILDLLEPLINEGSNNIQELAKSCRIELLYRNNANEAFGELINYGISVPSSLQKASDETTLMVSNELLIEALDTAVIPIRRFCSKYLRKIGSLSKDLCHKLLKDTDASVRREGILGLIGLDEPLDIDMVNKLFQVQKDYPPGSLGSLFGPQISSDEFIPLILRKKSPKDLLEILDFYRINNDHIYRILSTEYFDYIEPRIRSDLDDEFEGLRLESANRLKEKYGSAADSVLNEVTPELIEFTKAQLISAALDGLRIHGKKQDVKYARKFLSKTRYGLADKSAIQLIDRFGNKRDVDKLLEISSKKYGEDKIEIIKIAYRLCSHKEEFIIDLINNDDTNIAKFGIYLLDKSNSSNKIMLANNIISFKDDQRRLEGLAILVKKYNDKQLEKLLDKYISMEYYYYNIVTWIDRYLYAKGKYKEYYRKRLLGLLSIKDYNN